MGIFYHKAKVLYEDDPDVSKLPEVDIDALHFRKLALQAGWGLSVIKLVLWEGPPAFRFKCGQFMVRVVDG